MKILQVNKFYYLRGGSERYLFELSDVLEKNGHTVIPFAMRDPKNVPSKYDAYFPEAVAVNKFSVRDSLKVFSNWDAAKKLEELIAAEHPDAAHLHNIDYQITPAIIGVLKKYKIPIVQTLHDYKLISPNRQLFCAGKVCGHAQKGKFYQCLFHRCIKKSYLKSLLAVLEAYWNNKKYQSVDLFLAPSNFMKKTCVDFGIPEEKIKVLHNPIDLEKYQNIPVAGKNYLLYFGRLSEEKGVSTLIRAMAHLSDGESLKIAGDGPDKEGLEDLAVNIGLESRVEFVGPEFDHALIELISGAKAVIIPSIWLENMPMALLEAMALERVVIVSDKGGLPEIIQNGENGFIFQAGNVKDLTDKIKALKNYDLVQIGKKARESMRDLDIRRHYREIMEVYVDLVSKG